LPDGLFSNHTPSFGTFGTFFMITWYTLWPFATYISWQFGICFGSLVYILAVWYMFWQFGIFLAIR
jgi:hypothetical protein